MGIFMKYINIESCTSTNDLLFDMAKNGAEKNTVLCARKQTAGKGTNNRSFFSPENGIYMSVLLKDIEKENILDITPTAAVVVSRVLNELCRTDTKIKPVNDIYLNGKKLCGILTKAQSTSGETDFVIVGIGINLFRPKEGFPDDLSSVATYVCDDYDESLRTKVIETVAEKLSEYTAKLSDINFKNEVYEYYNRKVEELKLTL